MLNDKIWNTNATSTHPKGAEQSFTTPENATALRTNPGGFKTPPGVGQGDLMFMCGCSRMLHSTGQCFIIETVQAACDLKQPRAP